MTWEKNLVALRSLRSEHHANNIEPNVVMVNWNLGKRCNYDCSYCSPHVHDWVSPHHPINYISDFVTQVNHWSLLQNKTFNMSMTGGEPFVHPDIIEILKIIRQASNFKDQLSVITNGSMPLKLYKESLNYITHLTISLHLEKTDRETQDTLEKVIALHQQYPDHWITVQVMCAPGKLQFVETTVMPLLESNGVKFTLRRIRPWLNEANEEWQTTPKREILKRVYTLEQQTHHKKLEKNTLDSRLYEVYADETFYTAEELTWLATHIPATAWQNIAVWTEDLNYFETNSDTMVSNNRNRFQGWTCFVGVDSLFIDFNGLVYRGPCQNGGSIGQLGSEIKLLTEHTVCERQVCISNLDQTIRKSRPEFLHLITES
jgi:MoaA/NifB/PqqE/SkfB family radical SAM enzyme